MSKKEFRMTKLDGLVKNHQGRHPGESRGPEILFHWIPAFAGMTEKGFFDLLGTNQESWH
jgi:hypothetical protein